MKKKLLTIEELYNEFNDLIFFEIRKHLSDRSLIADCGQEVMLNIFKYYEKKMLLDYNAQAVYISKIACGAAINTYKKEVLRTDKEMSFDLLTSDNEAGNEYIMSDVNLESEVDYPISQLNEREREIIILFYYNEYSHKEIANLLGISLDASRQRLSRAKRSLKKLIEQDRKKYNEI